MMDDLQTDVGSEAYERSPQGGHVALQSDPLLYTQGEFPLDRSGHLYAYLEKASNVPGFRRRVEELAKSKQRGPAHRSRCESNLCKSHCVSRALRLVGMMFM